MDLKTLFESPYLNDEELPYTVLAKISKSQLKRAYSEVGQINDIVLFAHKDTGFIAGFMVGDHLSTIVRISCREKGYPKEPHQLENYQQVSMVNVSKEFAERGYTKEIYNLIAKTIDLVSDHEQFLGAKGLWKSLARDSDINVYVFNGNLNDYVRDEFGKIIKYNSSNLKDKMIWGSTFEHKSILLVATKRNLI